jgi:hypothetical protein
MPVRITATDLSKFENMSGRVSRAQAQAADILEKDRRQRMQGKYRNKPTMVGTKRFSSKLEAARYAELLALKKAGMIRWFVRHPRFDLPGDTTYEADFMIVWAKQAMMGPDPTVEDTKGVETEAFRIKLRQMREIWGIEIVLVRQAGPSTSNSGSGRVRANRKAR